MKHKYGIVSVIGTTPDCIGDNAFGGSEAAKKLRSAVRDQLDKLVLDGHRVFVFAGAIGTPMWTHQALNGVKKKFRRVLVLPKKDYVPVISNKDKGIMGYYDRMVKHADKVVIRYGDVRDYMVEHSDVVLAVFAPKKDFALVSYLSTIQKSGKEVITIDVNSVM